MNLAIHHFSGQLWLALRFPNLPLNVLGIDEETPKATVITEAKYVIGINAAAKKQGIHCGMDVTTAKLLCDCHTEIRDKTLEAQALEQLSEQLYQFTPYIETYTCEPEHLHIPPQAGLLLEISSCLELFSGIINLAENIFNYLKDTPYQFTYGLAHSAKSAWLLSFKHYEITGKEEKNLFIARLKTLPIELLYDFSKAVDSLKKTGFDTLGDIAKQIEVQTISSVKKRFGVDFANAICSIFGIEQNFQQSNLFDKPAPIYKPKELFVDTLQFDYPVSQLDQLRLPMETMLQQLSGYLRKRQHECQEIIWVLFDIYHNKESINIVSDIPQSEGKLFYELTHIQLEQKQLPFDIDTIELRCEKTSPTQNRSQILDFNLTRRSERRTQDFATTAAKLKARLGDDAVFKLSYCDSHLPESSNATIPINEKCNQQLPDLHRVALRPPWLLDSLMPIEARQQGLYWHGQLRLIAGPERIQGNWWNTPTSRDYFLAQRHDNLRLWIFMDLHNQNWYVQGIFG